MPILRELTVAGECVGEETEHRQAGYEEGIEPSA